MNSELVQLVCICGIVVVAVIAATQGKWDIVSMAMTGGFALLRGGEPRKDSKHEKTDSAPPLPAA